MTSVVTFLTKLRGQNLPQNLLFGCIIYVLYNDDNTNHNKHNNSIEYNNNFHNYSSAEI